MSQLAELPPATRSRGRIGVVIMLIVSIVATALTRDWAMSARERAGNVGGFTSLENKNSSASSLNSMPSFATALLLGGLRGPLVMILWTTSETQKQQHELQDFDTKVEWIRLLQPEFDTVHLFQIWNKAYNISVQMASLSNKYTTILDGLDYGMRVDKERPDDISLLSAIGQIYGDKLGESSEHVYYRQRVRRETQTLVRVKFPASREQEFRNAAVALGWIESEAPLITDDRTQTDQVLLEKPLEERLIQAFNGNGVITQIDTRKDTEHNDPSWRRIRLDPMVDENGNILPELLQVRFPRPADLSPAQPWYDGSNSQFLKQYEPYPYGLSSFAISYNYYKRAQLLFRLWHEHHIQSGDVVVDSRPALNLKLWGADEWERGRRAELRMFGHAPLSASIDPLELEKPTQDITPDQPMIDPAGRDAALYSYSLSAKLFHDARSEYIEHIKRFREFMQTYLVHVDDTLGDEPMMRADYDYLLATTKTGLEREQLLLNARNEYISAMERFCVTILKYYVDDAVMSKTYPPDPTTGERCTRLTIEPAFQHTPQVWVEIYLNRVVPANEQHFRDPNTGEYSPYRDQFRDERYEYQTYIDRCKARLMQIQSALAGPVTQPAPTTR